ncbi:type II secretion system F family protein [Mangrovivirga cuniculi]|uniref:Type II secretion system F family protein n=1 Tax=Mangrovivirga cuniculi TaxID=2715131 RepID=A0A4D7JDL5_9BACT|nr:type II secretion system F family protein [Mangrovivirga cuniculi]QCK13761.1 type II secretion system F family protein [Mangrovivirga cuniculi]
MEGNKIYFKQPETKKEKKRAKSKSSGSSSIEFGGKKFKDKDKVVFYKEISSMLNAGLDVISALSIVSENEFSDKTKNIITKLNTDISNGASINQAFSDSESFSSYEIFNIKIGEETGRVKHVFKKLSEHYEQKDKQKKQFINAMIYPLSVVVISVIAVMFMMIFIVPMFKEVFGRTNADLPEITEAIISLSNFIQGNFVYIIGLSLILFLLVFINRKKTGFRKVTSSILLKIPVIKNVIKSYYLNRLCASFSILISSNIDLVRSIDFCSKMIGFYPLEESLRQMKSEILKGDSLHNTLNAKNKLFDNKFISFIKIGEETNQLDLMFEELSNQYADELEHRVSVLNKVIEPVIIIFLGGFVGLILVAMYLPMFEISTQMGF